MSAPIDVLAFLDGVAGATNEIFRLVGSDMQKEASEARAAVAELIAADHAFDVSRETLTHVNNLIAAGSRSDDDFRRQANADHAYARAVDRRARAIAACKGETA